MIMKKVEEGNLGQALMARLQQIYPNNYEDFEMIDNPSCENGE